MSREPHYWFPAKRYGWGWGLPITWQGWIVLVGFLALVGLGVYLFPPRHSTISFVVYVVALIVVLVGICYRTGEPPRWRWGGK